jgi:hypothetical protein
MRVSPSIGRTPLHAYARCFVFARSRRTTCRFWISSPLGIKPPVILLSVSGWRLAVSVVIGLLRMPGIFYSRVEHVCQRCDYRHIQPERVRHLPGWKRSQEIFTSICLGRAASLLAMCNFNTPSLNSAFTFSASALSGKLKLRPKLP